jgi:rhodanese-related sulfurtransferase
MTVRDLSPVLAPADVAALLEREPATRLLDVRTPGEYRTAHIRGAYNVPIDSLSEHAAEIRAAVEAPVVVVCQSGMRARQAEESLRRLGMTNLHVLDGGVNGWVAAGQPVVRGARKLALERQVRMLAGILAALGGALGLWVDPLFALVSVVVGAGLFVAGATDTCGMALVLGRLPYNRPASCDVEAMVRALTSGEPPRELGRSAVAVPAAGACAAG